MFAAAFLDTTLVVTAPALKGPGIVGEWAVERQETGGGVLPFPEADQLRFVFTAEGKWAMYRPGSSEVPNRKYLVDLAAQPHDIDLGPDPDSRVQISYQGVFKVEADSLILCYSHRDHQRPKGITLSEDEPVSLFVMKRVK
jgi:uncharacterized protein (TIGR03067 family)